MIGKAEWFKIRKYGGWGVVPQTWQGWIYIAVFLIPMIIIGFIPGINEKSKTVITLVWTGLILVDIAEIMIRLRKDEREEKNEAVAERNAAWFMIAILVGGMFYQIISSIQQGKANIDPIILITLFGGAIVKSLTHLWLDKRGK